MSLVNGSNNNNPLAIWQSLLGQGASASGNAASGSTQTDPLSELLATIGQATGLATGSATGGTNSSSDGTPATTGSSSPQFDSQTLQALFDLQANASQSSGNGTLAGGGDNAFDLLAPSQGATSQTTANANGSTTTTITYADGSSVALTSAAASDSSSATAAAGVPAGVSGNHFLGQLIQMQAQLLNPNAPQSIATV